MPNTPQKLHAIVIGSGQGGNPLAAKLAKDKLPVAIIESGNLGGTCINTGCTPTKTMVASAQVAYYARESKRWGVHCGPVSVDMQTVLKRKRERVESSRSSWEKSFGGPDQPTLIKGRAHFTGPLSVAVGDQQFEAERIFLDTGTTPIVPPIEGLDSVPFLTNESLIELAEVPKHLLVLGGGYIGLEFAQMFRRFGSEITVIGDGSRILPHEDDDVADSLRQALEAEGIKFDLHAKTTRVSGTSGDITMTLTTSGAESRVRGSHLLVAVGRKPQTQDLQLEKAGVETDEHGFIKVNDKLETSAANIWALGDVKGGPEFTHISYNDFQIVYGNLYEGESLSVKTRIVPYAVYTDPPLGRVGITEKEAKEKGLAVKIGRYPMNRVARALEKDETAGLMKIVVDARTDKVLGATILGTSGDEVVQILHTLMLADKPYTLLKGAIYIHPTIAEGFFGLLDSVK